MEKRIETVERFSKIWWKSRADGKKSQEYMALSIGVSKKTIQNWEKGISSPNLFQSTEWFKALGLNPVSYYLEFLYPDMAKQKKDPKTSKGLDDLLCNFIKAMDDNQKENLIYILLGGHGGSYRGVLELMCAYCHLPLNERLTVACVIKELFDMHSQTDTLLCKDEKLPLLDMLEKAIKSAKESVVDKKEGYTIQHKE